jgi:hypothetical protein
VYSTDGKVSTTILSLAEANATRGSSALEIMPEFLIVKWRFPVWHGPGLSDALDQSYDPPQPLLDSVW